MIAVFLLPVYILVNLYIFRWLVRWLKALSVHFQKRGFQAVVILIYLFFSTSLLTGFLFPAGKSGRFLKLAGNYWLGVLLYSMMMVILADLIRLILKHGKIIDREKLGSRKLFAVSGTLCIGVILTLSLWGVLNARTLCTTKYEVTVSKETENLDSLNIVLIADLHLGYNTGCSQMKEMVEKINIQNPDIIVIAGDIFDNEYEALDDQETLISILREMRSKYGVYAVYGNHDIQEKILAGFTFSSGDQKKVSSTEMDQFLKNADITLLRDEAVLIADSFYLYGRPDYRRPGRGIDRRKTPEELTRDLDPGKPVIVLDHEPNELQELADAGVDIDLCGHTHDGQMFPGNLTINWFWENPYGYLQKDRMHNIVTSGVGVFGPAMRIGTKAEICVIKVNFS